MSGVETALVLGAVSAATAAGAAQQQNQKVKAAKEANTASVRVQARQLEDQAKVEQSRRIRQAEAVRGRVMALAAERGLTGESGSILAELRQATGDESVDLGLIEQNLRSRILSLSSAGNANLTELGTRQQSSLNAGIAGGVGGFSTGLSIQSGVRDATK